MQKKASRLIQAKTPTIINTRKNTLKLIKFCQKKFKQ